MSDSEALTTLPGRTRWLGVVSDTHGDVANTQKAVRMLESFDIDAVLHCGDIGSVDIPQLFQQWPTHYVLGNVDWHTDELQQAVDRAGGRCHGRFGALRAARRSIALLHGDDTSRLDAEIACGRWDLLCHGHTHQAEHHVKGPTIVLNPGALKRAWPLTIAVVELDRLEITSLPLG